jgi:hypothetical protein
MYCLGWIKLHRKLLEWEWYNDVNVRITFLHCLLKANYEDKKWKGTIIKRGSFISSISHLSAEIGITEQKLKTAIKKLKLTNEITSESTNLNTVFTVIRYDLYQSDNELNNKRVTNEQQTNNKQITTTKESNKIRSKEINNNIVLEGVIEYFNGVCVNLPKVIKVNNTRKKLILNRLNEHSKDEIKKVIDLTAESHFLNGKNKNGWTASFDWIMNKANFIKILEGNYKNKQNGKDRRQISVEDFNESIERHFR